MQNAALRTATGCTQDTNIQHLHYETLTYSSTPHNTNKNTRSITFPTQTHTYLNTPRPQKPTILNNGRYTTIIPTDPNTVNTTDIKTNMRHIHTSIVSRHLATRGITKYCAHLHHTLSVLKRYFPASLVTSLPNSEQIQFPSSNHKILLTQSRRQNTSITTMPPL